ncbi:MAG: DNA methyltransferase [Candidatus Diapherotrites archaeon]
MSLIPLSQMVTFSPNKNIPIHRWFYYREGFSKAFVDWAIETYSLSSPVLDPFCGVGTTLLACKENSLSSIGCDVSPLGRFVSQTKTRNYDIVELQKEFSLLKKIDFSSLHEIKLESWVAKRFHPRSFRELVTVKKFLNHEYKKNPLHDIALLALIDQTLRVSNVKRMGASLRRVKKGYLPVKKFWLKKIELMLKDLKKSPSLGIESVVLDDDARLLRKVDTASISSIITSPPYLNKIEYASAYKLELALFFDEPKTQLRSFVGENVHDSNGESALPIVDAYMQDMEKCLKQMHRVLVESGKAVINVAGGAFPDRIVNSDELLLEKAIELGFTVEDNHVARTLDAYHRHSGFVGKTTERVFVIKKE